MSLIWCYSLERSGATSLEKAADFSSCDSLLRPSFLSVKKAQSRVSASAVIVAWRGLFVVVALFGGIVAPVAAHT